MKYRIGDKVIFENVRRIKSSRGHNLKENTSYIVVGVDVNDGCPFIAVDDENIIYTQRSERKFILLAEVNTLTPRERAELVAKYAFIPESKVVAELVNELEEVNKSKAVDIAIDIALEQRNYPLLKKLTKIKGKSHNPPKEKPQRPPPKKPPNKHDSE